MQLLAASDSLRLLCSNDRTEWSNDDRGEIQWVLTHQRSMERQTAGHNQTEVASINFLWTKSHTYWQLISNSQFAVIEWLEWDIREMYKSKILRSHLVQLVIHWVTWRINNIDTHNCGQKNRLVDGWRCRQSTSCFPTVMLKFSITEIVVSRGVKSVNQFKDILPS